MATINEVGNLRYQIYSLTSNGELDKPITVPILTRERANKYFSDCAQCAIVSIDEHGSIVEILEKNGFEHKHQNEPEKRQYWLLKHDGAEVKAKVNRGKFYFEITGISKAFGLFCPSFSAHLDYLNELQHALRFCGIEKEIIL